MSTHSPKIINISNRNRSTGAVNHESYLKVTYGKSASYHRTASCIEKRFSHMVPLLHTCNKQCHQYTSLRSSVSTSFTNSINMKPHGDFISYS